MLDLKTWRLATAAICKKTEVERSSDAHKKLWSRKGEGSTCLIRDGSLVDKRKKTAFVGEGEGRGICRGWEDTNEKMWLVTGAFKQSLSLPLPPLFCVKRLYMIMSKLFVFPKWMTSCSSMCCNLFYIKKNADVQCLALFKC